MKRPKLSPIQFLPGEQGSGAKFSTTRAYRYLLWRRWDLCKPQGLVIGLNPAKADERRTDHTTTRLVHYAAREWGWGGLVLGNLGALVSTSPDTLAMARDWIGPKWVAHMLKVVDGEYEPIDQLVVAWGNTPAPDKARTAQLAIDFFLAHGFLPWCMGTTKDGHPRHPSRLPNGVPLKLYLHRPSML